ncbi:MAG: hypothetical protein IJF59_01480 [Clostridia bacterium]|nr:hypothetical protein [Clostridia bacterium]
MFEILVSFLFFWLLFKGIGLALRVTWGAAKLIASLMMVAAVPLLGVGLLFMGGIVLLLPLALVAGAIAILTAVAEAI